MTIEEIVETYLNGNYSVAAREFAESKYDVGELYLEFCRWEDWTDQDKVVRMLRIVTRDIRDSK